MKLEFDKILASAESHCFGEAGREAVRQLRPKVAFEQVSEDLQFVAEIQALINQDIRLPLRTYAPIENILRELGVPGYTLSIEDVLTLRDVFLLFRELRGFVTERITEEFEGTSAFCQNLPDPAIWLEAIGQLLDEDGNIRLDASEKLRKISKELHKKRIQLDRVFQQEVRSARDAGWLTDQLESIRNGRRVLSVVAEHKRKIKGIIHDLSSTGRTAFVEPESALVVNNDIFDLQSDFDREVLRILGEICNGLRPHMDEISRGFDDLVVLDSRYARARYGREIDGVVPKLEDRSMIRILNGRHPILIAKLRKAGTEPVPFDLDLRPPARIVLVSGPNAGGKTVLMKSVGLLQMMVQSGFPVPVSPDSTFGIFGKILVEIGDQQSLEDDLSTYSSHLRNMKVFLREADDRSLLLIDEFGSGTDPKIGGAIAEAALRKFADQQAMGIVTTHYGNLKAFAHKTREVINGAMIFDQDKLAPTYRFRTGRPGSSFAFEIARKSGLPEDVLEYTRNKAGRHQKALESLLVELQEERDNLLGQLDALKTKDKKLENLIRNYENLRHDLEVKRKRWKLEKKEDGLGEFSRLIHELKDVIRQVREEKDIEAAEKALRELEERQTRIGKEVGTLSEEVFEEDLREMDVKELRPGDHVRLRKGNATGVIERIERSKALVLVGALQMEVPLKELRPVKAPLQTSSGRSVQHQLHERKANFNPIIDIRGLKPGEALQGLEQFFDEALMADVHTVRVIHGKGKGHLRQLVKNKLTEYPVKSKQHLAPEQGGDGVTIVEFE